MEETGSLPKRKHRKKGQRFIYDDQRDAPRGFGLRITAAGGKAFVLSYTVDGGKHRKTIGDWPTWSLEAARRRKAEPLVRDLAADWLEMHATGLKSEKALRGYINNDLVPVIGRPNNITSKRCAVDTNLERSTLLDNSQRLQQYSAGGL